MTVICLGYRAGFVEAARSRGLDLHFVVEKVKPGLRALPYTKVHDLADAEETLRAVLESERRRTKVSAVVTGHEQALFTAAALRAALGLPGDTDLLRTARFRDKRIQKSSLSRATPTAACEYLLPDQDFAQLAARLGPKLVLKPADGFGSQATALITDQVTLDSYLKEYPLASDVQTVVESFVEGSEIHVDGIWTQGRAQWLAVSKYLGPLMGWAEGAVVGDAPLGPAERELSERAGLFATQVLSELGAPDTVFHLEAFVRPDGELVLGEVAARLAGALTSEILALTHGVDLYGASLDFALGRRPRSPEASTTERLFGFVYLNRLPERELTAEDFRQRFDLVELDYPPAGAGRTGSYGRWGHAVVSAPTHTELTTTLRAIGDFNRGVVM